MKSLLLFCTLLAGLAVLSDTGAIAQKKKDAKKEPRVLMALPLAVQPGKKQQFTLRGHHLNEATKVEFMGDEAIPVKIVSKGQAGVPDKNPEKVGDTQLVIEVQIPEKLMTPPTVAVTTPEGQTPRYEFLLETAFPVVKEKEPNDGFSQAMEVTRPCAIDGEVSKARDVDVFQFKARKGETVRVEVRAARQGSSLDSLVTIYNRSLQVLASNDDQAEHVDSVLEFVAPGDEVYYVVLIDAHDTGGNLHPYRLVLK